MVLLWCILYSNVRQKSLTCMVFKWWCIDRWFLDIWIWHRSFTFIWEHLTYFLFLFHYQRPKRAIISLYNSVRMEIMMMKEKTTTIWKRWDEHRLLINRPAATMIITRFCFQRNFPTSFTNLLHCILISQVPSSLLNVECNTCHWLVAIFSR